MTGPTDETLIRLRRLEDRLMHNSIILTHALESIESKLDEILTYVKHVEEELDAVQE